ncbi:putative RING-H2 finger protein ATL21A [Argentina anserina]|uniref:putative RING-H2 finger protein ATL21A n=1 Tax=Argentina anserina TaxID=57926 RepID=UPI0021766AD9|nr:putative RING-H2 finger protein ATL21A [Potentilla anserina]
MEDSTAYQYCGYPGFGLRCSHSGEPILDLPNNDSCYVRDINYTPSTITLVDIDLADQECPRAKHNISLGTLPFDYSPLDVNMSFYFNCISFPDPLRVPPIPCLGSYDTNSNRSYVFKEGDEPKGYDWSENCEEKVVVTVKETEEIPRTIGGWIGAFGVAMKGGFV